MYAREQAADVVSNDTRLDDLLSVFHSPTYLCVSGHHDKHAATHPLVHASLKEQRHVDPHHGSAQAPIPEDLLHLCRHRGMCKSLINAQCCERHACHRHDSVRDSDKILISRERTYQLNSHRHVSGFVELPSLCWVAEDVSTQLLTVYLT